MERVIEHELLILLMHAAPFVLDSYSDIYSVRYLRMHNATTAHQGFLKEGAEMGDGSKFSDRIQSAPNHGSSHSALLRSGRGYRGSHAICSIKGICPTLTHQINTPTVYLIDEFYLKQVKVGLIFNNCQISNCKYGVKLTA
jgi:hypothetical protein